jgi:1-acyl-sn-glycerol-3-phosphate acyltransferase
MLRNAKRFLKILTSGFLFSCLGVGGVLCTLLVCPLVLLLPGGLQPRQALVRRVMRVCFRLFVLGLELSGILAVETEGLPSARDLEGCLLLANHPSYLDVVILIARLPDVLCVVKEGVWNNPFFGPLVRSAGFVPNQGSPEEVLERGCRVLAQGRSLLIFPEGTRTRPNTRPTFHRGAAHLALRAGAPILPLCIQVTPSLLAKGDRWYDVPADTVRFSIRGGARIVPVAPAADGAGLGHRPRALTRQLEASCTLETPAQPA